MSFALAHSEAGGGGGALAEAEEHHGDGAGLPPEHPASFHHPAAADTNPNPDADPVAVAATASRPGQDVHGTQPRTEPQLG